MSIIAIKNLLYAPLEFFSTQIWNHLTPQQKLVAKVATAILTLFGAGIAYHRYHSRPIAQPAEVDDIEAPADDSDEEDGAPKTAKAHRGSVSGRYSSLKKTGDSDQMKKAMTQAFHTAKTAAGGHVFRGSPKAGEECIVSVLCTYEPGIKTPVQNFKLSPPKDDDIISIFWPKSGETWECERNNFKGGKIIGKGIKKHKNGSVEGFFNEAQNLIGQGTKTVIDKEGNKSIYSGIFNGSNGMTGTLTEHDGKILHAKFLSGMIIEGEVTKIEFPMGDMGLRNEEGVREDVQCTLEGTFEGETITSGSITYTFADGRVKRWEGDGFVQNVLLHCQNGKKLMKKAGKDEELIVYQEGAFVNGSLAPGGKKRNSLTGQMETYIPKPSTPSADPKPKRKIKVSAPKKPA